MRNEILLFVLLYAICILLGMYMGQMIVHPF